MKSDRARIQIGRISGFGLLELSRQRLRPSLQEASTQICPHCRGAGFIRSTESMALQVLRALEEEGIRHRLSEVTVSIPGAVALYVLNNKRSMLADIENRYGFRITLLGDDGVIPPDMRIERVRAPAGDAAEGPATAEAPKKAAKTGDTTAREEGEKKRPRRRRSRRKTPAEVTPETATEEVANTGKDEEPPEAATADSEAPAAEQKSSRRRSGRRGGRRRSGRGSRSVDGKPDATVESEPTASPAPDTEEATSPEPVAVPEPPAAPDQEPVSDPEPAPQSAVSAPSPEPAPALAAVAADDGGDAPAPSEGETPFPSVEDPDRPKRRGWWQKIVK